MSDQKLSRLRLLLALLITVFLFVNVFLLAYSISFLKQQKVAGIESEVRHSLLSFNIEKELLKKCDDAVLEVISEDLDRVGSLISVLEERFGVNDERVLEQKQLYVIMEIQHYLHVKDYNEICNTENPLIFFFYSNRESFEDQARNMGKILDTFKDKNPGVMVYSLDYDLDFRLMSLLKAIYSVDTPNVVVFDEGEPFTFNDIDKLNERLD